MVPPADWIHMDDTDMDPDQRADEDLPQLDSDFQVIRPALRIVLLNTECLSAAKRKLLGFIAGNNKVDNIWLQERQNNVDLSNALQFTCLYYNQNMGEQPRSIVTSLMQRTSRHQYFLMSYASQASMSPISTSRHLRSGTRQAILFQFLPTWRLQS